MNFKDFISLPNLPSLILIKENGEFFIAFSLNMWSRSAKIHIILLKIATGEH